MSIIEIKNLSFSYDKQVILEKINLSVQENDFLAIIGPNGGGKSTLLKLILGINSVKDGSIHIFGELPKKNLAHVGYVPQNTNVNTEFPIKVIEVVLMGHIGTKRPLFGYANEEKLCAMGALAQVGMEDFANEKIGSLSGGQRQRVMIARALCAHPKILILDEPTASIDVEGQKQIYKLLETLNSYITIIVVSHDVSVIMQYANTVVHINKTLSHHDISAMKKQANDKGQHFCEVELFNQFKEKK
ncbi:MAG: Zinc ABC transporter, ATP-binding protein ZnuC [uncultured Sulfurovum sp.]|uniref:Zinc ABC transporter, ATP-binding protein ZnuC n=1 Tax=uncultured Sulfurovum sp. TaxID=269237 RepID=A0A6S6S7C4_9BACT|nr:MAG: Zinc ABC transporter, ATP-binding protein ZnuC [uncultured Sulfurovum sp.]